LIENFRRVVLLGVEPDTNLFLISVLISVVAFFIAYIFFKHADATTADII
jgi:ABC-type polysaccharide/polyol phosphate export permease